MSKDRHVKNARMNANTAVLNLNDCIETLTNYISSYTELPTTGVELLKEALAYAQEGENYLIKAIAQAKEAE